MSASGVLAGKGYVQIGLDDKALYSGIKAMQGRMRSLGQQMSSVGAGLFGAGAAGLAPLIPAIMKASDAAEGYNRFLAVMGAEAKSTDAALEEMAKRIGRNQTELRDTASSFQGMFVGLGMTKSEAAKLATQMTELSLDFASFNNLADSDAQERFLAGLSGSGEVFDRFGINIKEAALKTKLAQMGIQGTATELQKTQARIAIITESMGRQGATRDATTTAMSFANQLKAIQAEADTAAEKIGDSLKKELEQYLPVVRENISAAGKWLTQNPQLIIQYAKLAAGVAAAGVSIFAAGKAIELSASAIGSGTSIVKTAVTHWKSLAMVGAAVASVYLAKKYIYDVNEAIQELNDQLTRAEHLNSQIEKSRNARDDKRFNTGGKTKDEIEQLIKIADLEAAGARRRQEGSAKRVSELSTVWKNMTGNKILADARQELEEMTKAADAASERAANLRKGLKELQDAQAAEAEAVKAAEEKKRAQIEKTQQVRALAKRIKGAEAFLPANLAESAGQGIGSLLEEMRKKYGPVIAAFQNGRENLLSVMSSTAARGLAARVETEKKTEDFLDSIASNTAKTNDILKNMPGLTLGT